MESLSSIGSMHAIDAFDFGHRFVLDCFGAYININMRARSYFSRIRALLGSLELA